MNNWQLRMFGDYPRLLRILSLTTGCICIVMSGSIEGFSSYAASIKAQYNYTQFEVDLLAAVSAMGVNFGYPSGYALENCGITGSLLFALFLSGGASLLIWQSTLDMVYYSNKVYLLVLYFFVFGFGVMFSHMTPLAVNMENFSSKHRGKVVASMISAYNVGASLLSFIYFRCFVPEKGAVLEGDLSGYSLFIAISLITTTLLAIVFTGDFRSLDAQDADEDFMAIAREMDEAADRKARTWKENLSFFTDPDFQLICWAYVLLGSVTYSFRTNVVFYLGSFDNECSSATVTIVQPIVAIAASFLFSIISDCVIEHVPRSGILLALSVLLALFLLVAFFYISSLVYFYCFMTVMLTCDGVTWTLTPTLLSEYFGRDTFPRAWGICTFIMSIMCLVCLEVFGVLYDNAKDYYEDPVQCHGLHCYRWSTVFFFSVTFITIILYAILLWRALIRKRSNKATERQNYEPFSDLPTEEKPLTKTLNGLHEEDGDSPPSYESITAY